MHLALYVTILVASIVILITGAIILGTNPSIKDQTDSRYQTVENRRKLAISLVVIGCAVSVGISIYFSTNRIYKEYRKLIDPVSASDAASIEDTDFIPSEDTYRYKDIDESSIFLLNKGTVVSPGPAHLNVIGGESPDRVISRAFRIKPQQHRRFQPRYKVITGAPPLEPSVPSPSITRASPSPKPYTWGNMLYDYTVGWAWPKQIPISSVRE